MSDEWTRRVYKIGIGHFSPGPTFGYSTADRISIFQFHNTRSARVPRAVFREKRLPGVLVVDRYAGYNKMPWRFNIVMSIFPVRLRTWKRSSPILRR
ncbi:MAG: transposase [bacterium]